jgi:hypothetical protein
VVLPESTAGFYRRPDIAYSVIGDIRPNHVSLAWDASRRSRLIYEFVESAIAERYVPPASGIGA